MKKIRCLIADDEMLSLEILERYLTSLENYILVAKCRNGIEVFNILKTEEIDLIFLDIQMPKLTGLELIKSLKDVPDVIFTTAFREYAYDGYEYNAIDYLLKPISLDRFLKAIDKYESIRVEATLKHSRTKELSQETINPFLYIKSVKKTAKVFLKDILFIEGAKQFVKVKTATDEIITYETLQHFEQRLPDAEFLRIHRSYIVSVHHIRAYTSTSIHVGDVELPIGVSYQRSIAKALNL